MSDCKHSRTQTYSVCMDCGFDLRKPVDDAAEARFEVREAVVRAAVAYARRFPNDGYGEPAHVNLLRAVEHMQKGRRK